VRVSVEVDVEDVLQEIDDKHLLEELKSRNLEAPVDCSALLERVWLTFRDRGDAPTDLREYVWQVLGKAL
jgi:predicted methyltransferase MtxX (methanogen marker protein 4)